MFNFYMENFSETYKRLMWRIHDHGIFMWLDYTIHIRYGLIFHNFSLLDELGAIFYVWLVLALRAHQFFNVIELIGMLFWGREGFW
jgi:hypothetical protein